MAATALAAVRDSPAPQASANWAQVCSVLKWLTSGCGSGASGGGSDGAAGCAATANGFLARDGGVPVFLAGGFFLGLPGIAVLRVVFFAVDLFVAFFALRTFLWIFFSGTFFAEELRLNSSSFLPALSAVVSQRGFNPRPAQVSAGFSGLRYFGATFRTTSRPTDFTRGPPAEIRESLPRAA